MRAVVTRVSSASVAIDGETVGEIGTGFLVLLGIGPEDTQARQKNWPTRSAACGSLPTRRAR